jgi:hypothetical protein
MHVFEWAGAHAHARPSFSSASGTPRTYFALENATQYISSRCSFISFQASHFFISNVKAERQAFVFMLLSVSQRHATISDVTASITPRTVSLDVDRSEMPSSKGGGEPPCTGAARAWARVRRRLLGPSRCVGQVQTKSMSSDVVGI